MGVRSPRARILGVVSCLHWCCETNTMMFWKSRKHSISELCAPLVPQKFKNRFFLNFLHDNLGRLRSVLQLKVPVAQGTVYWDST